MDQSFLSPRWNTDTNYFKQLGMPPPSARLRPEVQFRSTGAGRLRQDRLLKEDIGVTPSTGTTFKAAPSSAGVSGTSGSGEEQKQEAFPVVLSPREKQGGDSKESQQHQEPSAPRGHGGLGESVARMRFNAELAAATISNKQSQDATYDGVMARAVNAHSNNVSTKDLERMGDRQRIMELKLRGELRGEAGKTAWLNLAKEQSERVHQTLQEKVKPLGDTVKMAGGGSGGSGWLNAAMVGGNYDIF